MRNPIISHPKGLRFSHSPSLRYFWSSRLYIWVLCNVIGDLYSHCSWSLLFYYRFMQSSILWFYLLLDSNLMILPSIKVFLLATVWSFIDKFSYSFQLKVIIFLFITVTTYNHRASWSDCVAVISNSLDLWLWLIHLIPDLTHSPSNSGLRVYPRGKLSSSAWPTTSLPKPFSPTSSAA